MDSSVSRFRKDSEVWRTIVPFIMIFMMDFISWSNTSTKFFLSYSAMGEFPRSWTSVIKLGISVFCSCWNACSTSACTIRRPWPCRPIWSAWTAWKATSWWTGPGRWIRTAWSSRVRTPGRTGGISVSAIWSFVSHTSCTEEWTINLQLYYFFIKYIYIVFHRIE